jgi:Na+/H+ antiporter NhaC
MRNIIPIIFVAATVLVGCHSPSMVQTKTAAPAAPTPTVAAPAATAPPNTLSESVRLGDLGAAFIIILTLLALRRA